MNRKYVLLTRLEEIGRSLEKSAHALALIGLGSVGFELDRLDDYSDLDFFVIVEDGYKSRYIEDLGWLESIGPIAYSFRNTVDGYKLLFQDGVYCEFAVFELPELHSVPFSAGRIVWKQAQVDERISAPPAGEAVAQERSVEWLVGEALTNLYVGLCRYQRGEKLSAQRFIQHFAVDRILDLAVHIEVEYPAHQDVFNKERRFEERFPVLAKELPRFIQGYTGSQESALAILEFLEKHFKVNAAMAQEIQRLC